ncbi:hypothetical protein ALC62_04737 [Cyphomyrmex costatus]|uniref:Uncharacterized protein n=1 Tax=Cyphomyrmex costatus TaxID=456900 RepID=A0A151IK12_9HYME|nr:hypothetical protein ALC62_04737 [Cyphomyrmex costatus]
MSVRIVKLILDTIVHGYALHTVYGWSVYLIGAIWDSLTQLLLHLGRGKSDAEKVTASAPAESEIHQTKGPELQDEAKKEFIYLLLPPKETSTYTLELKG